MATMYGLSVQRKWEGFVPVSTKLLRSNTNAVFDLFMPMRGVAEPVLFHRARTPFTEGSQGALLDRDGRTLLVREEDYAEYRRYIENNLKDILRDSSMPVRERAGILYDTAQCAMREMFEVPDVSSVVERSANLVENLIDFQKRETWSFRCMLHVASFDYQVYTHSLNVCTFATALALRMNFSEEEMLEIGKGALLHDLGKSDVDQTVLNFPGKLSDTQFGIVKQHTVHGYDRLKRENCCSDIVLDMVRHHHEKVNGTGYPDGLDASSLSPWARICAIADIFDALTTRRVYKDAVKSYPALKTMHDEMIAQLDRDMFALFVKIMGDQDESSAPIATRKRLYDPV